MNSPVLRCRGTCAVANYFLLQLKKKKNVFCSPFRQLNSRHLAWSSRTPFTSQRGSLYFIRRNENKTKDG